MINSTYCDHFKSIIYNFRRAHVLTLLPEPVRAAKLDKLDFAWEGRILESTRRWSGRVLLDGSRQLGSTERC
jgi:hypothetical protein